MLEVMIYLPPQNQCHRDTDDIRWQSDQSNLKGIDHVANIAQSSGFVYLIGVSGKYLVKIGYSQDPDKRLRSLATGSPWDLFIIKTWPAEKQDERRIHSQMSKYRDRLEWFSISPERAEKHIDQYFTCGEISFDLGVLPYREIEMSNLELAQDLESKIVAISEAYPFPESKSIKRQLKTVNRVLCDRDSLRGLGLIIVTIENQMQRVADRCDSDQPVYPLVLDARERILDLRYRVERFLLGEATI